MARQLISTGSPFGTAAGYSRAVADDDFIFVSGTTGYDYATMEMPDGVDAQARNAFGTIAATLETAGFTLRDTVRVNYFLIDAADAEALFAVCGERLGDIRPAATLVIVAGLLRPEMKVEIELTARRAT